MPQVEVSFSPDLYPFYENEEAIVVVIDIFRATSAMCAAFQNGVKEMIPVRRIEDALDYKKKGYVVAAERKGEVVEGFQLGNSPFHYMNDWVKDKTIVITTTNGTRAISMAKRAHEVVVGSFLNASVLADWLCEQNRDVVLLCAGWRGRFNMEDSLFAGCMVEKLAESGNFDEFSDSAHVARQMFEMGKSDMNKYLIDSSHRRRLNGLNLEEDIKYCLQMDVAPVLPVLQNGRLIDLLKEELLP
ncbi:2-phosphosulfolactate phosphatase [bacterium SCSIO 12741]|nr:2-phosphosulfolactate phosphatase [bacterium SCSIO 12741]